MKEIIELAREYWRIRTSGELGEPRTAAHNALLDAMRKAGVQFATREHAAQIAHAMMVLDDAGIEMGVSKSEVNNG